MQAITGSRPGTFQTIAEQKLGKLRSDLEFTTIQEIVSHGMHEFIDDVQTRLNEIGEAVKDSFFTPQTHNRAQQRVLFLSVARATDGELLIAASNYRFAARSG